MNQTFQDVGAQLIEVVAVYGLDVVAAVVIFTAGWVAGGLLGRGTRRGLARLPQVDPTIRPVAGRIVRYTVLIVAALAALAQLGVETTSLLAVLGAAGLAIALALQGTLGNVAAGITLLILRPFRVGDFIEAGGIAGTVDTVGLFVTELHTADNVYLSVPNSSLWGSAIKNFSRNPTRRIELAVGIDYADEIDRAMAAVRDVVAADPRVMADPEPVVVVRDLGDNAVNLVARAWTETGDAWTTARDLTKRVKERFDAEGITIPFPQQTIHVSGDSPYPKPAKKGEKTGPGQR